MNYSCISRSFLRITPVVTAICIVTTVLLLWVSLTPDDTVVPVLAWDLLKVFMFRLTSAVLSREDNTSWNVLSAFSSQLM